MKFNTPRNEMLLEINLRQRKCLASPFAGVRQPTAGVILPVQVVPFFVTDK
jgi:hypothetical protein